MNARSGAASRTLPGSPAGWRPPQQNRTRLLRASPARLPCEVGLLTSTEQRIRRPLSSDRRGGEPFRGRHHSSMERLGAGVGSVQPVEGSGVVVQYPPHPLLAQGVRDALQIARNNFV